MRGIAGFERWRLLTGRELVAHWVRTLVVLGVVGVSAALLIAVIGIFGSLTGSVERLGSTLSGNAALEVAGITDSGFDQALLSDLTGVPGIAAAVPMSRTELGSGADRVLVIGVDARAAMLKSELQQQFRGIDLTAPDSAVVGAEMLAVKGTSLAVGTGTVTVAGVMDGETARLLNGGRFVLAPLGLAQNLSQRAGRLDSIFIVAAPGANPAELRRTVTAAVAGRAVVADPDFRTQQATDSLALLRYPMQLAASASLAVSAFLAFNVMTMTVTQRRAAISTVRALGGRKTVVARDLLVEAALTGLAGALIGIPLGYLAGRLALRELPPMLLQIVSAPAEFMLPWYAIPVVIGACVGATVVAAIQVVRQIYAVVPVEALTAVAAPDTGGRGRLVRVLAGLGGIAVIAGGYVIGSAAPPPWPVAGEALAFAGFIALYYALSALVVAGVGQTLRALGGPGRLGATVIARAPGRAWSAVVTVAIAISLTTTVTGANANLVRATEQLIGAATDADIIVSSDRADGAALAPLNPAVAEAVRTVPEVGEVRPALYAMATMFDRRVLLQGIAPGNHTPLGAAMSDRARTELSHGRGVVLSRDLAESLGVHAGDALELPTPRGIKHVVVLESVPVFSGGLYVGLGLSLPQLQDWYDLPLPTQLELTAAPGTDIDTLAAAVRAAVPGSAHVFTGAQYRIGQVGALRQSTALMSALQWIIALVAAVALLNTLMLSVLHRSRELGVLRAIGANPRFVLRSVLAEAAGIGIVGGVLGFVCGIFGQHLATVILGAMTTIVIPYRLGGTTLLYALAALALTLLGSIPPALRASRMRIVDAIAKE